LTIANRPQSLENAGTRPAEALNKKTVASSPKASPKFRLAGLALLGLFLVGAVLTKGLSAYLADEAPNAALIASSHNPTALLNLAEDKLAADEGFKILDPALSPPRNLGPGSSFAKGDVVAAPSAVVEPEPAEGRKQSTLPPAELEEIQSLAEAAIREDPLSARAFRILGQISEVTSDEARTEALMKAAVQRSQLQSIAANWMMRKSYQDKNFKEALRYADVLLRTRPQALRYVIPLLGKIAEDPFGAGDLKLLLTNDPPWRPQFLSDFPRAVTDARTPLDILLSLKDSANPPSGKDLRPYLDFLIQHGFYDLAYYTWLQFLPPQRLAQAGYLFNGSLDAPPSGTPFDWTLTEGTGVAAQVGASGDKPGERGLSIQFGPGRVDYRDISELIMLSPGSYQFHGTYKGDLVSERPLEWRVVCANKEQTIIGRGIVTRGGSSGELQDLDFPMTVPQTNCPAQYVKLVFDARSASEKFIAGSIWFDDFKIVRNETLDASAATGPEDEPQASEPAMPQSIGEPARAGETAVAPAAGGSTPETGMPMPPQAGGMEFKPKIYDPSMAPISLPPPAPQAQPPQ
jgi:hypothetical protein